MATRTPSPTTPESAPAAEAAAVAETRTQRLVDIATDEPGAVTRSRSVRPPVTVRNKRLAAGFGEAFLVWRCLDCGSLGSLDAFPTRCVCGARREDLAYVVED